MDNHSRPEVGQIEERTAQPLEVDGNKRIRGVIPFGVLSNDMGGWKEQISPTALRNADVSELRCVIDHKGVPLGRYPNTLDIEERSDGLHWSLDPPKSRADVVEAVQRGDLVAGSWRMRVARDSWQGETRTVEVISHLYDVTLCAAENPAYPAAAIEYRTQPTAAEERQEATMPEQHEERSSEERPTEHTEDRTDNTGGLRIETRAQSVEEDADFSTLIVKGIRDVQVGETRSLTSSGSPLSPTEMSTQLFEALRASSIALRSGIPVITTDREKVQWPKLNTNVAPTFYSEGDTITPGDPGFTTVTSEPQKIAHIVVCSNELIDDSDPPILQVLTSHLATMLALKLDSAIYTNGTALPGITGMNYIASTQVGGTIVAAGGVAGTATGYSQLLAGVGLLRKANAPPPYALACHPDTETAFQRLTDTTGQTIAPPPMTPTFYTSTQINQGTAFLYSPSQLAIVRRMDATVEVDRSRLFNTDQSEIRGKMRVNLIAPNPTAIVKLTAGTAA